MIPQALYIFSHRLLPALLLTVLTATAGMAGVTLLSDSVIEKISAGSGDTIQAWIEEGRYGLLFPFPDDYYYGTDCNGVPEATSPGSILFTIPSQFQSRGIALNPALYPSYPEILYPLHPETYPDGLYTDFEYRFANQADADRFQAQLEDYGFANIRQRIIYTSSSAGTLLFNDGDAVEVAEVFVITENEISPSTVNRFNGSVVAEPAVFRLHFPTIGRQTESIRGWRWQKEYKQSGWGYQYDKPGWPMGFYQTYPTGYYNYSWTHYYGKVSEIGAGHTDEQPIREPATGRVLVPPETAFIKATMAPMEISSPEVALAVSLLPATGQLQPNVPGYAPCQKLLPDFSVGYCPLGIMEIQELKVRLSGTPDDGEFGEIDDGNGIYVYPLEGEE